MEFIYDNKYRRVGVLSNDSDNGIHFDEDALTTSVESGLYQLTFRTPKNSPRVNVLTYGNYIETYTIHGKQLLLTIVDITDDRHDMIITCEDSNVKVLNGYAPPMEEPLTEQSIDYYLNHTLEGTNIKIKQSEADKVVKLSFGSDQRRLERLREIATAFELELDFDIDFSPNKPPIRHVSFLKKRQEDFTGFHVTSDDFVMGIQRSGNIFNLATMLKPYGATIEVEEEIIEDEDTEVKAKVETRTTVSDTVIAEAHRIATFRSPYQWGGNGNPSWDCSGFVQACYSKAGVPWEHRWTTYTMWAGQGGRFKRISLSELQAGDCIMYDTGYTSSIPNHVGIYLGGGISSPNSVIHAGNPVGITQRADSMKIIGYVRVIT